ncbi:hypothetical protein [Nonomuraea sp. NPDC050643]|uniref:hypothetical protein n=1 Tax=Nonomuraea sp. NPDC050643 TaxID=3155660 RepID=UPI0033F4F1A1
MTANPLHEALREALRRIEPMLREVEDDIEAPFRDFRTGRVWTGPKAVLFQEQFGQCRDQVRRAAEAVVGELRAAAARTPPQVTEEEAAALRKRYELPLPPG